MAVLAFAGLWISFRDSTAGAFLLLCCLIVYPLPYYLVNPFPRYKHAIEPEMLLLGDKVTSDEAAAWGLASRVVPDDQLDAVVAEYAGRLKELAPWGLAMTKEMLNRAASTDYSSAIEMDAFTQTLLMTADDFREFHAGFTEKRKPTFRGR